MFQPWVVSTFLWQFISANQPPHKHTRSNWPPCTYSWSYFHFWLFSLLNCFHSSFSWHIRPLYHKTIRRLQLTQISILLKTHFVDAIPPTKTISVISWLPSPRTIVALIQMFLVRSPILLIFFFKAWIVLVHPFPNQTKPDFPCALIMHTTVHNDWRAQDFAARSFVASLRAF